MFKLASLFVLFVSSISAFKIQIPYVGEAVEFGKPFDFWVQAKPGETATQAEVMFVSAGGTQTFHVQVGATTPITLAQESLKIFGFCTIAIVPLDGQASTAFSSVVIVNPNLTPRPIFPTYIPPYIPPYNPCYNPCYNPYRPICTIPRPRRESCNIPRPRCRIRESENSESVDFQMYYDSGLSLYLDQQAKAIEQFEREYEQHLIEQVEAETNVKVEA